MQIFETIQALQTCLIQVRQDKLSIGLVPTMGNLHAGHLELIKQARASCDFVLASIFVNPTQFGPTEDLDRYPRTFAEDKTMLEAQACDALFFPSNAEIYPEGLENPTVVSVPQLAGMHCGASRPGHFDGVCTVVNKLFNICRPDKAFFGEKDYQQLFLIRKMAQDLHMPIEVIGVATRREDSGLALSSRNSYLSSTEKASASILYQCLQETKVTLSSGRASPYNELEARAGEKINAAGLNIDYFHICNAATLMPASQGDKDLVVLVAAYLGQTRLIDNIRVNLP